MTYLLAAAAASGVFIAAGWRGRHARGFTAQQGWCGVPSDALWAEDEIEIDVADSASDVAAGIRLALKRLAPVMARQFVKVEIAAPAGLLVRMKGAALADLLEELLTAAINGAPASRLLITATMHGDRIYVGITDDMPAADANVRAGAVRSLMERVGVRGGALDVDVRPSEGTSMTLWLAASNDRQDTSDRSEREPSEQTQAHMASSVGG